MLQAIKGYYEDGNIVLEEQPPVNKKTAVIVTFIEEQKNVRKKGGVIIGGFEGMITVPDDFDEPLEDLKEYM